MKILITGGAGFIGTNLIYYLLQQHPDWQVVNLDKLTYAGNLENLKGVEDNPNYCFIHGDIVDWKILEQSFKRDKFDYVVNLAAESHVDRSIMDPLPFIETNIKGTQALLEASRRYGVKKFLQVSTDEVYGSLGPDDPPFTEESPIRPNSPYSASKTAADLVAMAYYKTYGLPVVITRCSNNYGSYQHPEKLIPTIILKALADKPIPVYGDGQNIRDWIHVNDHCYALELVLLKGRPGQVYNIGANQEKNNLEVVKTILDLMGKSEGLITFVKDRPGHDRRYAIDCNKIQQELGWQPSTTFRQALIGLIDWYITHRDWWERVINGEYREYAKRWYGELVK